MAYPVSFIKIRSMGNNNGKLKIASNVMLPFVLETTPEMSVKTAEMPMVPIKRVVKNKP